MCVLKSEKSTENLGVIMSLKINQNYYKNW